MPDINANSSMEHIRLISTACVKPQYSVNQFTKIELTPSDVRHLLLPQIQSGILFYKPKPDDHDIIGLNLIEHLKASFSRALDIFYPLAGRLAFTQNEDNTTSFFIDCNSAGAQFVHAAADHVTVADILDPVYVPEDIINSFFLMNGVRNYQGKSKPLLAVQVTELLDGIFFGMSLNHSVADGTSFWEFFNTWSQISRCGETSQTTPIFGREFLDGIIDLPVRIPQDLLVVTTVEEEEEKPPSPPPLPAAGDIDQLMKLRIFHFRKEKIAEIKSKANAEMGTSNNISSLQALMGHLWISITRVRRRLYSDTTDQQTKYLISMSLRQRLNPPLPDQYVGNAVTSCPAMATVDNLLKHGPSWAALELNKMIAMQTKKVANYWKDWVENPWLPIVNGTVHRGNYFLLTGSSPRYNIYGIDFGWGRPVAVRNGSVTKRDGRLSVYPGAEQGSIEFEACLSASTLKALEEDAEFMATVGV